MKRPRELDTDFYVGGSDEEQPDWEHEDSSGDDDDDPSPISTQLLIDILGFDPDEDEEDDDDEPEPSSPQPKEKKSAKPKKRFSISNPLKSRLARDSNKPDSRGDYEEGLVKFPSHDKVITRERVGEIIANQHKNKPQNYSSQEMVDKWIESKRFRLVKNLSLWPLSPFKYVKSNDRSYSEGPIIVDSDKTNYPQRWGSFLSDPNFKILDGKHRYYSAIRNGKTTLDAYVGDEIYQDLMDYIEEYGEARERFVGALDKFYDDKSRFAKSGDCGHDTTTKGTGEVGFAPGNTCKKCGKEGCKEHNPKSSKGKYSNMTKTKNFKNWFGNSVVTHDDGSPMVVYKGMYPYTYDDDNPKHITSINRKTEFPAFNKGEKGVKIAGFFGNKETANRFAESGGTNGAVYPVYLSIQKPYVIDAKGGKAGNFQFGESGRPFREAIRSGKYDGVIIKNTEDEGTIYVALEPGQIKSSISNIKFDRKKEDLHD